MTGGLDKRIIIVVILPYLTLSYFILLYLLYLPRTHLKRLGFYQSSNPPPCWNPDPTYPISLMAPLEILGIFTILEWELGGWSNILCQDAPDV